MVNEFKSNLLKDLAPLWINKLFFLMLALAKPQGRQIFVLFFCKKNPYILLKIDCTLICVYVLCMYMFIMNNWKVVRFLVCMLFWLIENLNTLAILTQFINLIYVILIRYVRNSFIPEKFKFNLTRWKSGLVSNTKSNKYFI
jgi:hypothetical protein